MTSPLQFFSYKKGILTCETISLLELVKITGTPSYIYSSKGFLEPLKALQKGLIGLNPTICFALKSNSNIAILKLLADAGAGMDLVSGGELHRASLAKVPAEKIVFSGVGKTTDEMAMALRYQGTGIFSFNIESIQELMKLNQTAIALKCKAPVALRFNPDVDAKTHPYISTGLKKNKFGMQKADILKITHQLHELKGIELKGISIHIGSQLLSLAPLNDAFTRVRLLIDELNAHLSIPLSFVDLGGGIGITYKSEKPPSLKNYCELIHRHFGKKSKLKTPLKILVEPGRTIAGNAGILLTQVLYRKEQSKKDFLVVDAAMNDLIRPALYQSYHDIIPIKKPLKKSGKRKMNVVGPVCESSDCFAQNRLLPAHLQGGDFLAILSAGAYGFTMASNYNSRPRPPEILIHQGKFTLIRNRETYDDLIRGEQLE